MVYKKKSLFLKTITYLMVATLSFFYACNDEKEIDELPKVSQEIVDQLHAAGFDTSQGLSKYKDGYLVEYDVYLTEENIADLANADIDSVPNNSNGRLQHYRSPNTVRGAARTLLVYMGSEFNVSMQKACDTAIARYNKLNLRINFKRTTSSGSANIRIVQRSLPPVDGVEQKGVSGYPNGGDPANLIELNSDYFNIGFTRLDAAAVIAHEIGHAIGFRHTDYMNISFSCGSGGGQNVDAIHIPGTPTTPSAGSWMLACSGHQDHTFTAEDIVALRYVYGSDFKSTYDLSSTDDLSIYLDYDGDGDDDVIFYRPGKSVFYLFEMVNGVSVLRLGSSSGLLNYDLNSVNDKIIKFDYNGDGLDDLLFYRPGKKVAFIMRSQGNGTFTNVYTSSNGFIGYDLSDVDDRLIATDYDNDGRDDIACYRPGTKIFYLYRSNGNTTFSIAIDSKNGIGGFDLSQTYDQIISLDYNGDGRDDLACYRPGWKVFYLLRSNGNGTYTRVIESNTGIASYNLDSSNDRLIRLNYDGDAYDDIAAYRPGNKIFYLLRSNGVNFSTTLGSNNGIMTFDFNSTSDKAIAPDYDGDGKSDLLCYRPGGGAIYYGRYSGNTFVREY